MTFSPEMVAIYIRWSTDDQSSGTTLDVQRERCLHYAISQGLGTVPKERIFIDEGYSGGDMKRPAIAKIRQLVKQGKIKVVVVYKIDRLSRNIVDAVDLVLREWDGVCRLACVSEPVDTSGDMGRMFFNILAMFADFERSTIRQRMHSGKVRRAQEGRNPGICLPYGYRTGPTTGSVQIDDAQAIVVKRVFELYLSGLGGLTIAQTLNREGAKSGRGAKWSNALVIKIIQNPAYIGKFIYGRNRSNPRFGKDPDAKRYVARDEPLAVTELYPPLIDEETFLRCQTIRTSKKQAGKGRSHTSQYLLSGLVRCRCGDALHGVTLPDHAGKPHFRYYKCTAKGNKGSDQCDSGFIPMDWLDAVVVDDIMRLLSPDNQSRLVESARQRTQEAIAAIEVRLASVNAELADIDVREARAKRDYKAGKLPPELFAELRRDTDAERTAATAQRVAMQAELEQIQNTADDHRVMERKLARVLVWDDLILPERKQLLAELIDVVVAYRPKRTSGTADVTIKMRGVSLG